MLYRRFERFINIFQSAPADLPPNRVGAFYFYYLRQVWPSFVALLLVGLVSALIEVALFSYLSRIIDLVNSATPATLFTLHWPILLWMAFVALILRPVFIALHDMLVHQSINPGMTGLIQWQQHNYVLRQSLSFFHNDFAGRIAQRIMQTGNALRDSAVQLVDAIWHVSIYAASRLRQTAPAT